MDLSGSAFSLCAGVSSSSTLHSVLSQAGHKKTTDSELSSNDVTTVRKGHQGTVDDDDEDHSQVSI